MPSRTQRGKSSTDINLVLDAMDALSGTAHIEEFFVASADADFTSLVQRFRAADRMTTVIAAGDPGPVCGRDERYFTTPFGTAARIQIQIRNESGMPIAETAVLHPRARRRWAGEPVAASRPTMFHFQGAEGISRVRAANPTFR